MATIRGLQRRESASEAVGTPGLDLSESNALANISRASTFLARQIEKNRAVTDQVDAIKEVQTTDDEIGKGIAALQGVAGADSSIDIADSIREQTALIDETNTRRLADIPNRKVRSLVALKHEQNKIRRINAINKWGLKLQGIKHLTNGTEIVNGLATQAGQVSDFGEFENLLQQGDEIALFTASGLDAKQGAKFLKDTPESIARGYLNSKLKNDPEQGLEDFQTKGVFNTIFDDPDEKAKIETAFVSAIEGKNILTNYNSALRLGTSFSETISEPEKLDDINWLNQKKNELDDAGQLTPQMEKDFNRQIDTVLKNNKLSAKRDPQAILDLSTEFVSFGINKKGEIKGDTQTFTDYFDFMMRLSQARADGQINDTQYSGMAGPLQIAIENSASDKQVEGSVIGQVISRIAEATFYGNFTEGWGLQSNPTNFGVKEVDKYLDSQELTEAKKKNVRGGMLADLFFSIQQDGSRGIDITNDSVRNNLTKIIKENSSRFGLPGVAEEGNFFLDPKTGLYYKQLPDGSYEKVEK